MAQRRMFSQRIGNSAKFLQMPCETQLLYFHMVLRADDDGVVELYPITRLLGVASDNIKVLLAKQFIIQLNEDQVMLITDWQEHNTIRADRKVDSIYKDLIPQDIEIIEAKPRSDVKDNSKRVGGLSMVGIGKVRLGKDKINKEVEAKKNENTSKVKESKEKIKKTKLLDCVYLTEDEYNKLVDRFGAAYAEDKINNLNSYVMSKGKKYKSHYHTILVWAEKDKK